MAGPWYTGTQLQQDVKDVLKKASTETLSDYWARMCDQSAATSYADLSSILLGKGYTIAQLDLWDQRAAYSRQQALFWLFTESALGIGYDDKEISKLDRRDRLEKAATIMINGVPVAPGGDQSVSGIGGGLISEDGFRITGETEF